jgi:mono/diheme cytochrome c family protein
MKPGNSLDRTGPKRLSLVLFALSLGWLALAGSFQQAAKLVTPTPAEATFFENKIRPVLAANCLGCHSGPKAQAGLNLETAAGLRKGGDSGAAFVAGDPEKSEIIKAIRQSGDLKMPPGGKKLAPAEVADFEAWVKMGAPWPEMAVAKVEEKLWSLRPVIKPSAPKVKLKRWVRNPIDAFVLAGLEAKKFKPAAPADRRTLLRRVTYDLTGLPPTAAEMDAFLADKSPFAYDKVVDRLLASKHYGERWARHWLDVARYADTKGYSFAEDRNYPNAYTYRDWVIDAFNKDLPYDQFIVQQLAADRLPEVQNGEDKKPLAALGFLTVGRRFLNDQPSIIDDRIDVTMRGFEGLTVACARCHDHKFDPIPTQDYYSLYAVFASSNEVQAPISERAKRDPWERYNQEHAALSKKIDDLILAQVEQLRKAVADAGKASKLSATVKRTLQALIPGNVPEPANLAKLKPAFEPRAQEEIDREQRALSELEKAAPPAPEMAMAMVDSTDPHDGYVFKRGKPENAGPAAPRRFLLALTRPGVEREHWTKGSGRLELAQAIASRTNPLTARVFVNRVWQDHFGAGLVRTPSDFGHQGDRPTDPKLLDFLASSFMDNGWSVKKLQRLIVTSATYRQGSDPSPALADADPDNRLWGRMNRRRLDLEEMRDSAMAAAGALDLKDVGGKSVDLWAEPFTPRRALYGFIERQNLPGIFRTFDLASPDSTSARRFQTTVPQQALFFMNSPFLIDQTRGLVSRPEIMTSRDNKQRIRRLYRVLFQRLPDADEMAAGLAYLGLQGHQDPAAPEPIWSYGYGGYDASSQRTSFTAFATFSEGNYRVGKTFPDPQLGYLTLSGQGGHPGHDEAHAVIRRWTSPISGVVNVSGTLNHPSNEGDGIRARIVSSRRGLLGEWFAHHSRAKTEVLKVAVEKGDTLDFVVDPRTNDGFDGFGWSPTVATADGATVWNAGANFGPPPGPPMSRLALYAQALMMTNEFMFVD